MDYDNVKDFRVSNLAARQWYNEHVSKIPSLIDKTIPIEQQARKAFELRNQYKTQSRSLMKDESARDLIEKWKPNLTFEESIADKMNRKNMTHDEAVRDILDTSTKTSKTVNNALGLEE